MIHYMICFMKKGTVLVRTLVTNGLGRRVVAADGQEGSS